MALAPLARAQEAMATAGTITMYPITTAVGRPSGIVTGPDGNLWFTESVSGFIGKMSPTGQMLGEYTTGGGPVGPYIAISPSGAGSKILFNAHSTVVQTITTAGGVSNFTPGVGNSGGFTFLADGTMWVVSQYGYNKIYKINTPISTASTVTQFAVPAGPTRVLTGADNSMWLLSMDSTANAIVHIASDGTYTSYRLPIANSQLTDLTLGPDNNIWFNEYNHRIGKITSAGTITEYSDANISPEYIVAGPDGNLWFTEATNFVSRITPTGTLTRFSNASDSGGQPWGLCVGPDGAIWFTDYQLTAGKIGRISTQSAPTITSVVSNK